jgi:CheY-like chemotaxis protein
MVAFRKLLDPTNAEDGATCATASGGDATGPTPSGASPAGASASPSPEPQSKAAETPGKVLLLDDEEPLVRIGKRLIERLGFPAEGFTSAHEALDAVRANPSGFSVFITDLSMPEMTGYDAAKIVSSIRPDIPIVLLSGASMDGASSLGIPNRILRLGKPYTRDTLAQTLADALQRS